jgi:hypothetical protein
MDSEESNSPAYVAWRAGTTNRVVVLTRQAGNRFLDSLKGLQIWAQREKSKPVVLRLSLAGNLEKPLMSLYGTEWRERGYELWSPSKSHVPYKFIL